MKKYSTLFSLATALIFLLSACGANSGASTPTPVVSSTETVVAEAHLVPNRYQYLSFSASGKVAEIPVKRGDKVTAGQVIASLTDREQAQAALVAAQLGQVSAQQDFDTLNRTAGMALAQAWKAYMDSQEATQVAQLAWDKLDQSNIQTNIDNAESDVSSRRTDLENAQSDFDKYKDLSYTNTTRQSYEDKLRTAQTNYDQALSKLTDLINSRDQVQAVLNAATAAEADAKRTYENCQNGPDVDKLALAQAALDNAKAQVAAAQKALDNFDLKAPFDGTVMDINVTENQLVGPQTWVVAVADTSQWYVDTSDLGEQDVVKVNVGDTVDVTADALPGVTMTGVVDRIGETPISQGTDILYTVHILLKNPDTHLRWGMTMEVTFNQSK